MIQHVKQEWLEARGMLTAKHYLKERETWEGREISVKDGVVVLIEKRGGFATYFMW